VSENRAPSPREQWGSSTGFVLATIGSAVGIGNIWRFSCVAGENGDARHADRSRGRVGDWYLTFVSIMADRPTEAERPRARMLGINVALIFRLALLVLFFFVDGLTAPVFSPFGNVFSWCDEILTTSPGHTKRKKGVRLNIGRGFGCGPCTRLSRTVTA